MHPNLCEGDWVEVIEPSFAPGSILVIRTTDSNLIAHRLLQVLETEDGPRFLTRGDNTHGCDPLWKPEQIAGEVIRVIRPEGNLRPVANVTFSIQMRWLCLSAQWFVKRCIQRLVRMSGCS